MALKHYIAILILTFVFYELCTAVKLKLTNLKCEPLDLSLARFRECRLKFISRGLPALNMYLELAHPTNALGVNVGLYKKASDFKPFLYNISIDFCEFSSRSSQGMLSKILYKFIAEYSNINHTCPFDNAIIVKNLVLTEDKFRLIPLPSGEYMLKIIFSEEEHRIATIQLAFSRIE